MERAKAKGRVSVRRNLFRLASGGNVAAAIFLAKNLLGYRDVVANEHSGEGGVRGFLSGTIGKKMGRKVESTKGEDGNRTYSIKG